MKNDFKFLPAFSVCILIFSSCWRIEDLTKKKKTYSFKPDQTAASLVISYLFPSGECVEQFRIMSYSSCENAPEINSGSCTKDSLPKGTYRYYKYQPSSDQTVFPIVNKVKYDYSFVKPCLFSGKENQIIDSNTPLSGLETGGSSQCESRISFSAKAGRFKCIAVYSACNADFELKAFSAAPSVSVIPSGTASSTMPVWSFASIPYSSIGAGSTVPVFGTDSYAGISLGFSFSYFGQTYSSVYISNNGVASFSTGKIISSYPRNLFGEKEYDTPDEDILRLAVAPWWGKLYADCSTSVVYETSGTSPNRIFTVEWKNITNASEKFYPTSSPMRLNFQMKLYETSNKIEFHYGQSSGKITQSSGLGTTDTPTVGISSGTAGIFMNGKSGSVKDTNTYDYTGFPVSGTVYRFTP